MERKRVLIYTRLSKDRPDQTSTTRQERDARAFAKAKDWDVAATFSDVDLSAYRKGIVRQGYDEMLAELRARRADGVVVWKLDRLTRRMTDFAKFKDVLEQSGAFLASVQEPIDTSTPLGQAFLNILATFAEMESATMSVRIKSAKTHSARAGKPPRSGRRAYGLTRDWSAKVPAEAKVVREASRRVLAGESMRSIVLDFNARGIPSSEGGLWSNYALRHVICSPRIAGLREHHGEIVASGLWPALLPEDEWRKVVAVLDRPDRRHPGRPSTRPLIGMLWCGNCGRRMRAGQTRDKKARYVCPPPPDGCNGCSMLAEGVDLLITETVFELLDTPALARRLAKRPEPTDDTAEALAELAEVQRRSDELAEMFAAGEIDRRGWSIARSDLERRDEAARRRLAAADGHDSAKAWAGRSGALRAAWPGMSVEDRRAVLAAVIDRVTINRATKGAKFDPDRVAISWRG